VEWSTLNAAEVQFTAAETSGCAKVSSNSSRAEKVCAWKGEHPGLTVSNLLNHTRIERAHKVRKKTYVFYYVAVICTTTGGTELTRAYLSRYDQSAFNCAKDEARNYVHVLHAQVCCCISAHPGLPYQKKKRETIDASKSQLNLASWNWAHKIN